MPRISPIVLAARRAANAAATTADGTLQHPNLSEPPREVRRGFGKQGEAKRGKARRR
jgi:hypothetical protein